MSQKPVEQIPIVRIEAGSRNETVDHVAVEEPLEIQLCFQTASGLTKKNIAVTMRTPGHDADLATGFLFTEGIIRDFSSIEEIKASSSLHTISIVLKENVVPNLSNADRNFYSTSSCGICGKGSLEAIRTVSIFNNIQDSLTISSAVLFGLQDQLKKSQRVFEDTGGIHASAFFDVAGQLLLVREDVGRHNALDKLIGVALAQGILPMNNGILLLSGRAGFELVQKAVMAGIRCIAAVGAPSSLAVELAEEYQVTLIGFLRDERFNIYSGKDRIL